MALVGVWGLGGVEERGDLRITARRMWYHLQRQRTGGVAFFLTVVSLARSTVPDTKQWLSKCLLNE